jgi:SAM-dependent methyltransferase
MQDSPSFYNSFAETYDNYCSASSVTLDDESSCTLLLSHNPKSILEFGVGTGRFANLVLNHSSEINYTGVDNSKEMLARCTNTIITYRSDINVFLDTCIQNKISFDCIISPYTELHHIPTIEQRPLLEKMKQVAKHIFLNCLTEDEEFRLFTTHNQHTIQLRMHNKNIATTIYSIDKMLRKNAKIVNLPSKVREFLVYTDD